MLAGFVNAVAINISIILSQVDEITRYTGDAGNRVGRAIDTLLHPGQLHYGSVLVAALTMGLILVLERTALGALGMVVAIALASGLLRPSPQFRPATVPRAPPLPARHRSPRSQEHFAQSWPYTALTPREPPEGAKCS